MSVDQNFSPNIDLTQFVHPNCNIHFLYVPYYWPGSSHEKATGIIMDCTQPAVVDGQLDKMQRMVPNGKLRVCINYYGPSFVNEEKISHNVLERCAARNIPVWVMVDKDCYKYHPSSQWEQYLEATLQNVKKFYTSSPVYWKLNGRIPISFFIDPGDDQYLNWQKLKGIIPNSMFIFESAGGFNRPQSDGAFGWVNISKDPTDIGLGYLSGYYYAASKNATKLCVGGAWSGFDDHLASWSPLNQGTGPARVMLRNNGATLLQTLGAVPASINELMISTWNDHEEGSANEFGVAQYN